MAKSSGMSLPVQVLLRLALTIVLVYGMSTVLDEYFFLTGGAGAVIVIGALLTLMNLLIRPLLHLLLLPFKLFMGLFVIAVVNAGFLWITLHIADQMDPQIVQLSVEGGVMGWIIVAAALGIANWLMRMALK